MFAPDKAIAEVSQFEIERLFSIPMAMAAHLDAVFLNDWTYLIRCHNLPRSGRASGCRQSPPMENPF
jgi:hypothetical protein